MNRDSRIFERLRKEDRSRVWGRTSGVSWPGTTARESRKGTETGCRMGVISSSGSWAGTHKACFGAAVSCNGPRTTVLWSRRNRDGWGRWVGVNRPRIGDIVVKVESRLWVRHHSD